MRTYRCNERIKCYGKLHAVGEPIDLDDKDAAPLLALGRVTPLEHEQARADAAAEAERADAAKEATGRADAAAEAERADAAKEATGRKAKGKQGD